MLRAIGASRRQLLRSVLFESVAIGVIASAVGLVAGVGMSFGLKGAARRRRPRDPRGRHGRVDRHHRPYRSWSVVSVTVTCLGRRRRPSRPAGSRPSPPCVTSSVDRSAVSSVRRAVVGLVSHRSRCRRLRRRRRRRRRRRPAAARSGRGHHDHGCVRARPGDRSPGRSSVIGWPVAKGGGTTGQLARENATRNPKRTAATASALMIGVALVGLHHDPGLVDQGLGGRRRRQVAPGRLRRRVRLLRRRWLRPRRWPRLEAARRGRRPSSPLRTAAGPDRSTARPRCLAPTPHGSTSVFDLDVIAGSIADVGHRRGRGHGGTDGRRATTSPSGRPSRSRSPGPA